MNKIVVVALLAVIAFAVPAVEVEKPYETWDELATYVTGLNLWYNIAHLDFQPESWRLSPHPPFGRYVYGAVNGLYLFSQFGTTLFSSGYADALVLMADAKNPVPGRLLSVLFASGTVVLLFLIVRPRMGTKTAILASLIYTLLPATLAQTRMAELESILAFMFSLSVYLFLNSGSSRKRLYSAAIVTGLAISTKFNALSLLLLLPVLYLLERPGSGRKKDILLYPLVSFATLFAIWPRLWTAFQDIDGFLSANVGFWTNYTNVSEYFLGGLHHPFFYTPAYVVVTMPALVLAFLGVGVVVSGKTKAARPFLAWFLIPLLGFVLFHLFTPSAIAQAGPSYVFMIYPGVAAVAAIGVSYASNRLAATRFGRTCWYVLPAITVVYLAATAASIHPYYLDYYSEVVGGPANVYHYKLFALGQWGEGIDEAAFWVNGHAKPNASVQFFVMPRHTIPKPRPDLRDLTPYVPRFRSATGEMQNWDLTNTTAEADYLVENLFFRWYMNESFHARISQEYSLLYTVSVQSAPIAWVYGKNQN